MKTVSDVATNVATIAALAVGAFWAYWAFIRERTLWPRAGLTLLVSHRVLGSDRALLHVKVIVQNLGSLRITAQELRVDVCRVLPLDPEVEAAVDAAARDPMTEVVWPELPGGSLTREWGDEGQPKKPEVEPGESDEFCFDLVAPRGLESVQVYAYLKNVKRGRRELGWGATAFYDLSDAPEPKISFGSAEPKQSLRSRPTPPGKLPSAQQEPKPRPGDRSDAGRPGDEGASK